MSAIFEGRTSESPYTQHIWRGWVEADYHPVCPANMNWNLLFMKENGQVRVTVEGATTQHVPKTQFKGREFLVIKFALGVYMPYIKPDKIVNTDALLPNSSDNRFWLNGDSWQIPDFDNVETFVNWLVRSDVITTDMIVDAAHNRNQQQMSTRNIRRRYRYATGITPKLVEQIERCHQAVSLLQTGMSFPDVAYTTGYSDQAHMTRSIKRFYGTTPKQLVTT